jgi:hypothetical protein
MRRREFVTLIGAAAAWPLAARGQQMERMRSVGVLMTFGADACSLRPHACSSAKQCGPSLALRQILDDGSAEAGWITSRPGMVSVREDRPLSVRHAFADRFID